jgi:XisI protein
MGTVLKQTQMREIIMDVLSELAQAQPLGDLRLETLFDTERDRYQVMVLGWLDGEPFHDCLAYVTLRNQKVSIEIDTSDFGLTDALVKAGVSEADLTFGFSMPTTVKHNVQTAA